MRSGALGTALLSGLLLLTSGCDGTESLSIVGPDQAAVGELTTFYVSTDPGCGKAFGGPSDPTGLLCPPTHGLATLVDASCDGGACSLESVDSQTESNNLITLHIVGNTAGATVLHVRAALTDGSQMSATSSVSFVTATGLHVSCALATGGPGLLPPRGQCGGMYPVFTSSSWQWTITFDSASGPLAVDDPSVAVQGDSVAFDSASSSFQSGSTTGLTQVVISSRQFTKTVPVRVVSVADVVSGELVAVTPTDGIDEEIAQLGPAPSTLWYPTQNGLRFGGDAPGTVALQSLLTLSDGTQVYGGGGLFASDHPEVCTVGPFAAGANLLQQTSVQPECLADGSATFTATVGAATIAWPVTVAPPPGP